MAEASSVTRSQPSVFQEEEAKWCVVRDEEFDHFLEVVRDLGGKPGTPLSVPTTDHYVDSEDRFFWRARCRCRLRCERDRWYLSFKEAVDPVEEVCTRRERSLPLAGVSSFEGALQHCRERIFPRLCDGVEVSPLFTLHNQRQSRTISFPGGVVVEASFDRVVASRGEERFTSMEIELECQRGEPMAFRQLVAEIAERGRLAPQPTSKYDVAAGRFRIADPMHEPPAYRFGHASGLDEAAHRIVHAEFEKIRMSEPAVRVGAYSDAIHDMRVACRKIRAAVRSVKSAFDDDAKACFEEVFRLGKVLGAGRDLEVHTACLGEVVRTMATGDQELLADFCADLAEEFEFERARILEELDSPRYGEMMDALEHITTKAVATETGSPVVEAGPTLIRDRLARVIAPYPAGELPREISDDELHRLRIRLKRVRYLSEFFLHVASPDIAAVLENTRRVQKLLGEHQDYRVGREIVQGRIDAEPDAEVSAALMRLLQQVEIRKQQYRDEFIAAWPGYCRDPFAQPEEEPV